MVLKECRYRFVLPIALAIGASALAIRDAQALIFSTGLGISDYLDDRDWTNDQGGVEIALGLALFFPTSYVFDIILDREVKVLPPVDRTDLADSGYSKAQIDRIFADIARLNQKLKNEKKNIELTDHETRETIRRALRSYLPDASEEFLDVFTNRLLYLSQAERSKRDLRENESPDKTQDLKESFTKPALPFSGIRAQ